MAAIPSAVTARRRGRKGVDEMLRYPGTEEMFRRRKPPGLPFVSVCGRFGLSA